MSGRIWTGVIATYEVRYVGGDVVEVTTGMPDALRWERNNSGKSLIGTNSLTVMMALVWYALRRQHLSDVVDFDEWAASVEDLARVTQDEPDPTQTGQSAD